MPKSQFNARLPELTHNQIDEIAEGHDMNKTEVVALAVHTLWLLLNNDRITIDTSTLNTSIPPSAAHCPRQ
jgi:hypothetical protein